MAITSQRPAKYRIGDHVVCVHRGTSRSGRIVATEDALNRRGYYRPMHLYTVVADTDGETFDVLEEQVMARTLEDAEYAEA